MQGLRLVSTPPTKRAGIAISGWDRSGVIAMKAARFALILLAVVASAAFAQHGPDGRRDVSDGRGDLPRSLGAAERVHPFHSDSVRIRAVDGDAGEQLVVVHHDVRPRH